jgi:two-component system, chemotaxis family, protein-glutamate methylesterase/glutaminase
VPQVRVLVVDDSVVMRRVIARTLERHPSIAQTDFAGDGAAALAKITTRRPDVVVLDLEMPVLDGFETLKELRRTDAQLPVVLFSSLDERVAAATLEACSLGATDFVVKPRGSGLVEAEDYVRDNLTPLVIALASARPQHPAAPSVSACDPAARVDAVVIGTSTGGPDALTKMVGALPTDLPVPVLVVQHMPPMFTRLLAERLHRLGGLPVREAAHGDLVTPGTVYVAPGNRHLQVARVAGQVRVVLGDGPPQNSCRPAADVLFCSAVDVYGGRTLAVVLTGMGHDGLRGAGAVRAAGGQVLVQDPATALINSMPGSVLDAGLAQAALPLEPLARELVRRVGTPAVR